jgi:hypothetical protein
LEVDQRLLDPLLSAARLILVGVNRHARVLEAGHQQRLGGRGKDLVD